MLTFESVDEVLQYLANNSHVLLQDERIRMVIAEAMSIAVENVVYNVYTPTEYIRREDNGGLSDPRNLKFVKTTYEDGILRVSFENVTKGQTHQLPIFEHDFDSLHKRGISETIEYGIKNNWYVQGRWSEARPFMKETADMINANPTPLINAIKKAYKDAGFDVR